MQLQVIGSGSGGNAYLLWGILNGEKKAILLDAGLPSGVILKAVGYDTSKIAACFVTHEHGDHASAVYELSKLGIKCYGNAETAKVVRGLRSDGYVTNKVRAVHGFIVQEFETNHDAVAPCGYLIYDIETKTQLVYATDTYYLTYKFPGVEYWLVECNYCDEYLDTAPLALRYRLEHSHMSLSRLCKLFKENDLSKTRQIILCHISRDRGNIPYMVDMIRNITHKKVDSAMAGATYNLDDEPF